MNPYAVTVYHHIATVYPLVVPERFAVLPVQIFKFESNVSVYAHAIDIGVFNATQCVLKCDDAFIVSVPVVIEKNV